MLRSVGKYIYFIWENTKQISKFKVCIMLNVQRFSTCSIAHLLSSLVTLKYIRSNDFRISTGIKILNMYNAAFMAHNILLTALQDMDLKPKYNILYVNAASSINWCPKIMLRICVPAGFIYFLWTYGPDQRRTLQQWQTDGPYPIRPFRKINFFSEAKIIHQ
jgi:hypothetical protein